MSSPTLTSIWILVSVAAVAAHALEAGHVPSFKTNTRQSADTTVHVIFSNHLDVGYTALDNEVINLYLNTHFPKAVRIAEELRAAQQATAPAAPSGAAAIAAATRISSRRQLRNSHHRLTASSGATSKAAERSSSSSSTGSGASPYPWPPDDASTERIHGVTNAADRVTALERAPAPAASAQVLADAADADAASHAREGGGARASQDEAVAEDEAAVEEDDRLIYTTHAWLLSLFLDCPGSEGLNAMGIQCPNASVRAEVEEGLRRGDITWHAFPFNGQAEVYDASMYSASISIAHQLDERFGLPHKITMSQRDVPGLTRAALPLLARRGVRFLSVGVNRSSAPPAVPHLVPFVWRDAASGAEVLAAWHPGGYGGYNGTSGLAVDDRSDCIAVEGFNHVLCVAWRQDNAGPPDTVEEVRQVLASLRSKFPEPGTRVRASTFDEYAQGLGAAAPSLNLTTVTGEIGDTWVYGTGSDPIKMSDFRAAMRARRECLEAGECSEQDPSFQNHTRLLSKVGEHTWGLAVQALQDWGSWSNDQLQARLSEGNNHFMRMEESWHRQARYIDWAMQALGSDDHFIARRFKSDQAARAVNDSAHGWPPCMEPPAAVSVEATAVVSAPAPGSATATVTTAAPSVTSALTAALADEGAVDDVQFAAAITRAAGPVQMWRRRQQQQHIALSRRLLGTSGSNLTRSQAQNQAMDEAGKDGASDTTHTVPEQAPRPAGVGRSRSPPPEQQHQRWPAGPDGQCECHDAGSSNAGAVPLLSFTTTFFEVELNTSSGALTKLVARWPLQRLLHRQQQQQQRRQQQQQQQQHTSGHTDPAGVSGGTTASPAAAPAAEAAAAAAATGGVVLGTDWAGGGSGDSSGAGGKNPGSLSHLGLPMYSTYGEEDFVTALEGHYSFVHPPWYEDFGKPNSSAGGAMRADVEPTLVSWCIERKGQDAEPSQPPQPPAASPLMASHHQRTVRQHQRQQRQHQQLQYHPGGRSPAAVLLHLRYSFPPWTWQRAGAPREVRVTWTFPDGSSADDMIAWREHGNGNNRNTDAAVEGDPDGKSRSGRGHNYGTGSDGHASAGGNGGAAGGGAGTGAHIKQQQQQQRRGMEAQGSCGGAAAALPRVGLEVTYLNKTATRLPEALWLHFKPHVARDQPQTGGASLAAPAAHVATTAPAAGTGEGAAAGASASVGSAAASVSTTTSASIGVDSGVHSPRRRSSTSSRDDANSSTDADCSSFSIGSAINAGGTSPSVVRGDGVDPASWRMCKLGSEVSPLEVVLNGSYSMHAVGEAGVSVAGTKRLPCGSWRAAATSAPVEPVASQPSAAAAHATAAAASTASAAQQEKESAIAPSASPAVADACVERLRIGSLDVALVSPGAPTPLPNPDVPPDMTEGMAYGLTNNVFGTNFIMWLPYGRGDSERGRSARFRFWLEVSLEQAAAAGAA